ncbi:GNAT family N-acetyltransferase [Aureimonas sp. AU40]|uniref:GNAT family N-acetyltransferase n=1 Tax=Aureimonas sp. AU40 TaxID=1637747 RepID=UPI000782DD59|nr:hypothetical protein [Aureimonas sp. AU40]
MTPAPAPALRLRGMEPGDLEALARIEAMAERAECEPRTLADLKRFLPRYEVFVADINPGEPVGFAAAAPLSSLDPEGSGGEGAEGCFWIAALRVDPTLAPDGTPAALLGSVADRARWFFCRAMGVLAPLGGGFGAEFYGRHGFMAVDPVDWTPALRKRFDAECPPSVSPDRHRLMIRWL